MVERLFPRALLTCIADDRPACQHELAALAEKVRHEAFRQQTDSRTLELAMSVARNAVAGETVSR